MAGRRRDRFALPTHSCSLSSRRSMAGLDVTCIMYISLATRSEMCTSPTELEITNRLWRITDLCHGQDF